MKIKITDPILDYEDKPISLTDENGLPIKPEKYLVWRTVVYQALNNPKRDETLTAEDSDKSYQITTKVYRNNEPDLTVSELGYILERIDKVYMNSPLIRGKAHEFFNKPESAGGDINAQSPGAQAEKPSPQEVPQQ